MPFEPSSDSQAAAESSAPDDRFLIASVLGGDESALRKLMDRYDRFVRYCVFRTAKQRSTHDPDWLDSVASAVWAGFVQSIRRTPDREPESVQAYLAFIARNQAVSALRRDPADPPSISLEAAEGLSLPDRIEEPTELVSRLESLEALRVCLAESDPDDRTMIAQLPAIMDRRWRDAAEALGLKESTLRSRWERFLDRLRTKLAGKSLESFAPAGKRND